MKETPQINTRVERIGSVKDYTTGRKGTIIEISGDRCRVNWTHDPCYETDGKTGKAIRTGTASAMSKPVRTWVNKKFLKSI